MDLYQLESEELDILSRIMLETAGVNSLFHDDDFTIDFKRKMIYQRLKSILESLDRWVDWMDEGLSVDESQEIVGDYGALLEFLNEKRSPSITPNPPVTSPEYPNERDSLVSSVFGEHTFKVFNTMGKNLERIAIKDAIMKGQNYNHSVISLPYGKLFVSGEVAVSVAKELADSGSIEYTDMDEEVPARVIKQGMCRLKKEVA